METPRALWRAFLPPVLYWWPFYVTPTFLGLIKSSTVAPHWCSRVTWCPGGSWFEARSLSFPVLLWAVPDGIKTPAELFSASYPANIPAEIISLIATSPLRPSATAEIAPPLSYLPTTVEISHESPRATADSYGGSTPVSTYQADHNNSSSQSSNTHHPQVCGHI